jgi:hypothetical protein
MPCKALTLLYYPGVKAQQFLFVAQYPGCSHFERIGFGWIVKDEFGANSFLGDDFAHWKMEDIVIG